MYLTVIFDDKNNVDDIKIMNSDKENPDILHKAVSSLMLENTAKTFADNHNRGDHDGLPEEQIYKTARICNALSRIFDDSVKTSDPKSELNICQAFANLCNLYIKVLGLNRSCYPTDDEYGFPEEMSES